MTSAPEIDEIHAATERIGVDSEDAAVGATPEGNSPRSHQDCCSNSKL